MAMHLSENTAAAAAPVVLSDQQEMEALDSCHREVLGALRGLVTLLDHLDAQGVDATARRLAANAVRFFSETARAHHADEERVVFPGLLRSDDAVLVQHVQRLQQDHGWLEEDWLSLSPQLDAVSKGYSWYDIDELRHAVDIFTALYQDHIDLEESLIYPEARRLLAARTDAGRGRERAAARR